MLAILPFSFIALVKANSKVIKRHTETISFRQTIAFAEKTVENVQSWTLFSLSLLLCLQFSTYCLDLCRKLSSKFLPLCKVVNYVTTSRGCDLLAFDFRDRNVIFS